MHLVLNISDLLVCVREDVTIARLRTIIENLLMEKLNKFNLPSFLSSVKALSSDFFLMAVIKRFSKDNSTSPSSAVVMATVAKTTERHRYVHILVPLVIGMKYLTMCGPVFSHYLLADKQEENSGSVVTTAIPTYKAYFRKHRLYSLHCTRTIN